VSDVAAKSRASCTPAATYVQWPCARRNDSSPRRVSSWSSTNRMCNPRGSLTIVFLRGSRLKRVHHCPAAEPPLQKRTSVRCRTRGWPNPQWPNPPTNLVLRHPDFFDFCCCCKSAMLEARMLNLNSAKTGYSSSTFRTSSALFPSFF
jgi:hypothetical protein